MIGVFGGLARRLARLDDDPVLRAYGAALAAANALTAVYWFGDLGPAQVLSPTTTPVCWPFFEDCFRFRLLPEQAVAGIVAGLLVASMWNAFMFMARGQAVGAYVLLVCVSIVKYLIVFQDFRLTLNHHYMAGWMTLAYVVTLDRKRTLPWLLLAMYIWAGVLKLDPSGSWLTGAAMYGRRPFGMPEALVPAACAYVIVLELGIVWGLLSRRPWVFWSALAQVVLFHVGSFWVVGWFYPMLMFLLLTIFPLNYLVGRVPDAAMRPVPVTRWSAAMPAAVLLLFSSLQIVRYTFPGQSAVTGEGRILALNMFDAPLECRSAIRHHVDGADQPWQPIKPLFANARIRCDPLVFLELARAQCRKLAGLATRDIDLRLETRRYGTRTYDVVVDLQNVCKAAPAYSMWSHNPWILVGAPRDQ
ncbi:MAG TPA: hypothetical protein VN700_14835 [Vicinamibacterales bacterium]|nr:hypothetical protein [Vicinamibacterales bacterium]